MDTDAILTLLQDVAAEVIDPRFRTLTDEQVGEKNPGDLVTVADHEAEVLITEALLAAYPGAVVLGEEAFATDAGLLQKYAAAEHAFTVDPVDGTKNFVNGSKDHAVMVAEVREGVVTRAWIWQPQHGLAYVAERGGGAQVNGLPLRRPGPSAEPREWRGVTSRRRWLGRELPGLRPLELTWVCCGVDYPHLVAGHADFVLYGHDNPWDHAPGSLILRESGAYLGTLDGRDYDPRRSGTGLVAAADRATYDAVVERLGS
ncbi:MAG: inositol monophosphatase [Actinomycetota bacterium]|nr:inositol monophosphatase [Actinomycetota bacterium]